MTVTKERSNLPGAPNLETVPEGEEQQEEETVPQEEENGQEETKVTLRGENSILKL